MFKIIVYKILIILKQFIMHYIPNYIINKIPFYSIRTFYYKKIMKIDIGKKTAIHMGVFIQGANPLKKRCKILSNTTIGRNTYIDIRGGLEIGKNVSISPNVKIITAQHDVNSSSFQYISKKVIIEDYVWIGMNAIILPGIIIEKGAVIAAGAIVTKDVKKYNVVGGNPAKFLKFRNNELNYELDYFLWFD